MNPSKDAIGSRIKQMRKSVGMNQEELGDKLGFTNSNVSNLEKGASTPTIETVLKLAAIFNVSVNWLITGEHENVMGESRPVYNNNTSTSHGGTMTGGDQKVNFGGANQEASNEWKEIALERKEENLMLKEQLKKCQERLTVLESHPE